MNTIKVDINEVFENDTNPREITSDKFAKLVNSIKDAPWMLDIRPIVVNDDMVVLGGNMRLKACRQAGLKEVPIVKVSDLTEEQQKEFIIKDNVGFGQWDWDILGNDWDLEKLEEWGLELEITDPEYDSFADDSYTKKIDAPEYEPSDEKPELTDLVNTTKSNELVNKIQASEIDNNIKNFLIMAAQRHLEFDYSKIADFYAHAEPEVQELMEESALIIIDFQQAIAGGYVKLNQEITDRYLEEYGDEA